MSVKRMTVVRCPDRDTADRVLGALKKGAERLNDTTLALDADRLLPAERKKLRDHGILVGTLTDTTDASSKKKAVPKRRYY